MIPRKWAKEIYMIKSPLQEDLQGRIGMIRIKRGYLDIALISADLRPEAAGPFDELNKQIWN